LALVGGLSPVTSDPQGIFVFRNEAAKTANHVLGCSDLTGEVKIVYILNLTKPTGIFIARDFTIRDQDSFFTLPRPPLPNGTSLLPPLPNLKTL
jgi:polysaccharide export outer membrane protein